MKRIDFKLKNKAFVGSVDRSLINIGFVVKTEFNTRIYRDPLLNVAVEAYSLNADILLMDTLQSRLPLFDMFYKNGTFMLELKRH